MADLLGFFSSALRFAFVLRTPSVLLQWVIFCSLYITAVRPMCGSSSGLGALLPVLVLESSESWIGLLNLLGVNSDVKGLVFPFVVFPVVVYFLFSVLCISG